MRGVKLAFEAEQVHGYGKCREDAQREEGLAKIRHLALNLRDGLETTLRVRRFDLREPFGHEAEEAVKLEQQAVVQEHVNQVELGGNDFERPVFHGVCHLADEQRVVRALGAVDVRVLAQLEHGGQFGLDFRDLGQVVEVERKGRHVRHHRVVVDQIVLIGHEVEGRGGYDGVDWHSAQGLDALPGAFDAVVADADHDFGAPVGRPSRYPGGFEPGVECQGGHHPHRAADEQSVDTVCQVVFQVPNETVFDQVAVRIDRRPGGGDEHGLIGGKHGVSSFRRRRC